jgi:hypothetical protein
MPRRRRFDSGANAYGGLPAPAPGQKHRDAPLSGRGRILWVTALVLAIALFVAVIVLSLQSR